MPSSSCAAAAAPLPLLGPPLASSSPIRPLLATFLAAHGAALQMRVCVCACADTRGSIDPGSTRRRPADARVRVRVRTRAAPSIPAARGAPLQMRWLRGGRAARQWRPTLRDAR